MYITGFPTVQVEQNNTQKQTALGKDEFLKLLTAQMKYQDPLKPQDSNEFMNQMTELSVLEQLQNISTKLQNFFETEQQFQTVSMLGKNVTAIYDGENTITGVVESVNFTEKGPKVVISGQEFLLNQVQKISVEDVEKNE